jgi:UDP-N-acetylmuramate dehydrogenase
MAIRIDHDRLLAPLTTLQVGGPADHLVRAQSQSQVVEAIWHAQREGLELTILGGGSNSLVADQGVSGLVLQPALLGRDVTRDGDLVVVEVGAGVLWDDLVAWSVAEGLCGLEALSGIPGWVGAAPMQNIGAYGQEVASVVDAVQVVSRQPGASKWLPAEQLGFAYRMSSFKGVWRDRFVITAVRFRLRRGRPTEPKYAELAKALGGQVDHPEQVRQAVLELRRGKSMVIDDQDPNHRSAGSFFLNPILSPTEFEMLRARVTQASLDSNSIPNWLDAKGVKVPAAWLMERAGLTKGFRLGAAELSTKHCLALINPGSARACDLLALAAFARRQVAEVFGVRLVPEPVFVGFSQGVDALLRASE